jgi:hypothetical protein
MGLDIDMFGAKELLSAFYGQILYVVRIFAAAVISPAGIALGIFVRKYGTLRF